MACTDDLMLAGCTLDVSSLRQTRLWGIEEAQRTLEKARGGGDRRMEGSLTQVVAATSEFI